MKAKEIELLKNLKYTVFGLGDSQYENFCAMGNFFHKNFAKLGGTSIYKMGEGDDDADLEADFRAWKRDLWSGLIDHYKALCTDDPSIIKIKKKMSMKTSDGKPIFPLLAQTVQEGEEIK